MSRNIGEVRVSVLPDGTRFKPEATADLKKAVAGMQARIPLEAVSDKFKIEAEKAVREVGGFKATIKIDGDAAPIDRKMAEVIAKAEALKKVLGNVKLGDPNGDAILKNYRKDIDALSHDLSNMDSKSLDRATAKLGQMATVSDRLGEALHKNVGAQDAIAKAAEDAGKKLEQEGARQASAFDKAGKAVQRFASEVHHIGGTEGVKIKVNLDDKLTEAQLASLRTKLDNLKHAAPRPTVALNTKPADAELKGLIARMDLAKGTARVYLDDKLTKIQITELRIKLDHIKANVPVHLDQGKADADAIGLRAKLNAILGHIKAKVQVDQSGGRGFISYLRSKFTTDAEDAGSNAGKKTGKSFFSKFSGAFTQGHAIAAAVIAGLAALPAAIGAVGVLGGIALGAGIVFAADKMIQSQIKTLTGTIKQQLTGSAGITQKQLAVTTTQNAIAALEATKKLTPAQQNTLALDKQRLVVQKQLLANAKQSQGIQNSGNPSLAQNEKQLAQLQKELVAFQVLNAALRNLKQAFIQFAIVAAGPLLKPFTDAANFLSKQLNGPLRGSFTALFKSVAPLIHPVLVSLLEIVQGILPGMTLMLNKTRKPLSDMFTGFGKIVGTRLGQWFKDAIPYMQASVKYFLGLINALGQAGSFLIRFGGESAKAFGNPALKGFGPIIERIANDLIKLVKPAFEGWVEVMAPVAKAIAKIVLPLLDFLANNPKLVKAITTMAAAWLIAAKAIAVVNIALKLMGKAELGNPWIALAAVIVLAAVLIVTHWKPISAFFAKLWHDIYQGFVSPLINFFTKSVPHATDTTISHLNGWVKNFEKPFTTAWNWLSKAFGTDLVNFFSKTVPHAFDTSINHLNGWVKDFEKPFTTAWNWLSRAFGTNIANFFTKTLPGWWSTSVNWLNKNFVAPVQRSLNGIWSWISRTFGSDIANFFTKTIPGWWSASVNWLNKNFVGPVRNSLAGIWSWISRTFGSNIANFFTKTLPGWWNNSVNFLNRVFISPVRNSLAGIWSWISRTFGTNIANFFTKSLPGWWNSSVSFLNRVFISPVRNALSGTWNWISRTFGTNIANFFTRTLPNTFNTAVNGISRMWGRVYRVIKAPIHLVGADIMAPLFKGIDAVTHFVGLGDPLASAAGWLSKLAGGGQVRGGTPGKDSVPALLMPGEVVVPTHMVKRGAVDHLRGRLPGFAAGGMVPPAQKFALGGYVNPMARAAYVPSRIDQGVDFVGSGPILAIGPARIVETGGSGWPGGPYMAYQLTGGADAGRYVYLAENIKPTVKVGQRVAAGQTIANMFNGGTGIEMGWAAPGGRSPLSQTAAAGGISGGNLPADSVTAVGADFERLLVDLGATRATNAGQPASGRLPKGMGATGALPLGGTSPFTWSSWAAPLVHLIIKGVKGAINLSKAAIDLGHGDVGGAVRAMLGVFKPNAEGAQGNFGKTLLRLPGTLIKDAMKFLVKPAQANATNAQNAAANGSGPPGGASGSAMANGLELEKYLAANLFHGKKIPAAGAAAAIYGESGWNPFAQGSGGRGLIGWTPPSKISNAVFKGGMRTQLPAIIKFVNDNGDGFAILNMMLQKSVLAAANIWGQKVERFGVNDVHPAGVALATQLMSKFAKGGVVNPRGGPVFDRGGTLSPGANLVYNLTGRPEPLVPPSANGGAQTVTLEITGGQSDFEQFFLSMIRRHVRIKGAGNVQKAFGRHN